MQQGESWADLVGKTLGVYQLETSLGKGGMATVYRAYQAAIKRYVAVKVMAADIASDPGFVERFSREAEVIASLQHPHILPVIDYGETDGLHYLVMRYLDGGSLEDRLRKLPVMPKEAARYIDQIASALDYAHKRGVIHRDFKASNVLLDGENNTYLTDFGIARLAGNTTKLTATGTVMGTPAYMSPEQAMGRPVDGRSDIYSMGVVVYEMMTRRLPFVADTPAALVFQHVYEQPVPPRNINPTLSATLEAVILRTLAKDPDDRYQTAGEMAEAFRDAVYSSPASPVNDNQMEGTMIGGPMAPIVNPTPGRLTSVPGAPSRPNTPAASVSHSPTVAVNPPTAITGAPPKRGLPIPLIAAVVVAILILLGGGGLVASNLSTQNNSNNTKTADANGTIAGQTQIAMIALSATATFTPTFTPSPTNTATFTPSLTNTPTNTLTPSNTATATATATATITPSPTATDTPNATLTVVALKLKTVAAFNAGQTATQQQADINGTRQAAIRAATSTAAAINATNTARAPRPTRTPLPTATETDVPPTDLPTPADSGRKYAGTPDSVMADLQNDGVITAVTGQITLQPFNYDLPTTDTNSFLWKQSPSTMAVGDFVMSAQISWEKANLDDSCGFLFHLNKPATNINAFHSVFIDPNGHVRAVTHVSKQDDVSLVDNASAVIDTTAGGVNDLLVIGQGNAYRVFVNGKRVAVFSSKTRFDGGGLTVAAATGNKFGAICHFTNIWAWQLDAGSSAPTSIPTDIPTDVPTDTPTASVADLATGLLSDTPGTVIAALQQNNIIPATGAKSVVSQFDHALSISTYKANQGGEYYQLSTTIIQNLVLSLDLTIDLPEPGNCGVYFNSDTAVTTYLTGVFLESDNTYEAYNRINGVWDTKSISGSSGTSRLFRVGASATNRLTLVVLKSQVSIYINGVLLTTFVNHALDSHNGGTVGFYMDKYKSSPAVENCSYKNATLWRLP